MTESGILTCEEIVVRLDDHVDGLLDPATAARVEAHLQGCPACQAEEQGLRALLARAAALPRDIAPARDLWAGVAERVRPARARFTLSWPVGLAAAATLAAVSSVLTSMVLRDRPAVPSGAVSVGAAAPPVRTITASVDLGASEAEYLRATDALLQALEAQRAGLPAETVRVLEDNLRTIDQALADIRVALAQAPDDTGLVRMLVSTHRKKVDTLERVLRLSTKA